MIKEEDLEYYIFSKTAVYELRVPLWNDPKTIIITRDFPNVVFANHFAVYRRIDNHVYNEQMEKLYEFRLHHIVKEETK